VAAIADFSEVIRLTPDDPAAFVQRGYAYHELRDADRAVADFTEAIRLKPDNGRAYFARALAHRRRGDYPAALADASAAIEHNAKSDAGYNLRASIHYQMGQFAAALTDHQTAHEIDPEDAATLNHLAWLRATCPQADVRDAAAAIRDATRACELTDYAMPGYLDTLAAAYAEAGRFEDAVRWQGKAIKLVENERKADYESRLALYQAGQPFREVEEPPETPSPTSGDSTGNTEA
jgi:tetratricopeptide (TPR) repeat protein